MAIIGIHTSLSAILRNKHQRLDAKYFAVQEQFAAMAERHALEIAPLDELHVTIQSGSYIGGYTTPERGIPYIRVADIKPFTLDEYEDDLAFIAPSNDDDIEDILTKRHDILIARTQASTDKLGTAALIDDDTAGWATSQHVTRLSVSKESPLSPFYLAAYCNSRFFKAQTALASQGDTRVEFTHSQLAEMQVVMLPSAITATIIRQTQQALADNRRAMRLIAEAKQELLNALHLPHSLERSNVQPQQHFSTNLSELTAFDIWNATAHTPYVADMERHISTMFPTVYLGEIAQLAKGDEVGSDNYDTYLNKQDRDYAFIRTSDILNHEIDLFPDYFIRDEIGTATAQNLLPRDILFTKDGKIGQVAMVSAADRAVIASGVMRVRCLPSKALPPICREYEHFSQEYIFAVLALRETGFVPALRRTVIGTTIPHLRGERLAQMRIPLVPNAVMQSVSDKIHQAFSLKTARKKAILAVTEMLDSAYNNYMKAD